ncbi:hypothetical protein OJAV_G00141810 [Oryzias javanicus]|uniref:Uncharacterized protein n=1 Tax=Oryzias javanicus TaxID=123683 RepID=A0A3S2PLD9_ORYJA|nr:hypothetical protein OJAV_G00141810 [Oryzias javanicus]
MTTRGQSLVLESNSRRNVNFQFEHLLWRERPVLEQARRFQYFKNTSRFAAKLGISQHSDSHLLLNSEMCTLS